MVKTKHTQSCGCLVAKSNTTHGLTKHKLYSTWAGMMHRCYKETGRSHKNYGARGITVHQDWHNVKTFINDMYPSYVEGLSIDRINNDLGYSKDNCRWTNGYIQTRNTRRLYSHNKSGYRGVHWHKIRNKFISRIKVNSKQIHLGCFDIALEAAKAYDKYVIDNNLEHTRNFIID